MRRSGELSAPQLSLLEIMREHQFGRIENMSVRNGQPILDPNVKVVRIARLGGGRAGRSSFAGNEFELKRPVPALFEELARLQNGTVISLEFRHGLPFLLEATAHSVLAAEAV